MMVWANNSDKCLLSISNQTRNMQNNVSSMDNCLLIRLRFVDTSVFEVHFCAAFTARLVNSNFMIIVQFQRPFKIMGCKNRNPKSRSKYCRVNEPLGHRAIWWWTVLNATRDSNKLCQYNQGTLLRGKEGLLHYTTLCNLALSQYCYLKLLAS